jgi:hypothetical protein
MVDASPPAATSSGGAAPARGGGSLAARLSAAGRAIGAREAEYRGPLETARARARELHAEVAEALAAFHAAAREAGAPHLALELSEPRLDQKHARAIEFEVRRGRHVGVVTVKARGEVTLVGPFQAGKAEGPCRTFPIDARAEIEPALGEFLERLVEAAATP